MSTGGGVLWGWWSKEEASKERGRRQPLRFPSHHLHTIPLPHPQSTGNMAAPDDPSHLLLGEALLDAAEDVAAPVTSPLLARAATLHDSDAIAWEERLWKEVPQSLWDKIVMRDGVPGLHDSKDVCRVLDEALYDPRIHKVCLVGGVRCGLKQEARGWTR